MILDLNAVLSSSQAITVTAVSTGVYDVAGLGVNVPATNITGLANSATAPMGEDIGGGGPSSASPPQLGVFINTPFTAGGAATMRFQLEAAVDAGSGVPGTYDIIVQSDDIPVADLITSDNPIVSFTVPKRYPGQGFPRFYRLNYLVSTGPMTAGALSAYLMTGIDDNPIYPANY
jgi:hypothetical protein